MTAGVPSSSNTKLVPIAPDGGWGFVVVLGSFLIHVFADGFVYAFGVLIDTLMVEFGSDNATCALILSLLTGLTLGSGPLASAICNKYGCRTTTVLGSCIALIGCTGAYFSTAMWQILASVGVTMGVGFGLMYCPAIVIVTMYFEKYRSLATGIAVAGAGIGTMVFSPINSYMKATYGWRSVFLLFDVLIIVCGLCGLTFRPLKFREVTEDEEEEQSEELKKAKEEDTGAPETATLLVPDGRTRTKSASSHTSDANAAIRAAKSLSHVGPSDAEIGCQPRSRCGTISEKESGYLNRKDVFYTGSITNVAEFQENPDKYRSTGSLHQHHHKKSIASALSIGKLDQLREASEDSDDSSENTEGKNMFKTISKMLSLSLLLEPTFLLFAISNMLTSVGFNSPLYFLPKHAKDGLGLTEEESSRILAVFGLVNTIGRVSFGLIADHPLPLPNGWGENVSRNRLWMYNISLTLCGVFTLFTYLFDTYISISVYAGLFGFTIASYICLTSVILVDLLGLEKLTNAFGLLLLWQGVGTVFGPPIAGILADVTGTYTLSFAFCGVNLMISGLMLFAVPYYQKKARLAAKA